MLVHIIVDLLKWVDLMKEHGLLITYQFNDGLFKAAFPAETVNASSWTRTCCGGGGVLVWTVSVIVSLDVPGTSAIPAAVRANASVSLLM